MNYKISRLEKIFEKEISLILFNSNDERLKFVTITYVKLTNDVQIATIYYTVRGNEEQKKATSENLEQASGFIKKSLSQVLEIRKIPQLKFKYDESFEYGNKIESILKEIKK